jgi:uncharacterized membrane protein
MTKLEHRIALFLRVGLVFSAALLLVGWVWGFRWQTNPYVVFQHYDQLPLEGMLRVYLRRENWAALLVLAGLASLICLPIIRVIFTIILFLRQGERSLAGVAVLVLLGLFLGFALGIVH